MICLQLIETLGLSCYPLSNDGEVAMIATPFKFEDGDEIPVFIEKTAGQVRFFDDGGVLMHFLGRGLNFDNKRKLRFLNNIAGLHGTTLNEDGELEIWSLESGASNAFAKYMATILALTSWEKDQKGTHQDVALFFEEVEMYLTAWKRTKDILKQQDSRGVSGHTYKLDFIIEENAFLAIYPSARAVSSALRKMIDITSSPSNQDLSITVILDDRKDQESARAEGLVLGAVADVLMMSRLEHLAGAAEV